MESNQQRQYLQFAAPIKPGRYSRKVLAASSSESKPPTTDGNYSLSFVEEFLLSGSAAVIAKTSVAPIDRIKLALQSQDELIRSKVLEHRFNGIPDCGKWILKNEGVAAFWRSNFTNCLRYFPAQGLNFAFKGQIKTIDALKRNAKDSYGISLGKNVAAGGMAGVSSLFFVYSLDYARTRLANDLKSKSTGGKRQFNGLFDVYRQTLATDGIRGMYRGFTISATGMFAYRGLYFGLYDTVMPNIPNQNMAVRFAVGYMVTVTAGLLSYPFDTLRRRMMMNSGGGGVKYSSTFDCIKHIIRNEGPKSFFNGAGANILRGAAGAGVLSGFDTIKDIYIDFQLRNRSNGGVEYQFQS